jgi:hypothetical protein
MEERDWRRFLKEHNWSVGEKGREARIEELHPSHYRVRPLSREEEQARERFSIEAMGRSPGSFKSIYG